MTRKRSVIILATIAILVTLISPLFFIDLGVSTFTYTPDNVTVSGVLSSDSYALFPYSKNDLTIGFSKYGEMIDNDTKIGLLYNGTDPFAPDTLYSGHISPPEYQWVEGWVLNITYNGADGYMNIWAHALHSDYYNNASIGGNWQEMVTGGSANLSRLGGRKTNGGAITDNITVLYNGPRKFVALLRTVIYETDAHDIPLVSLTFTIIFNKDKKQVIILKDIKRVDYGKNYGEMQVEFGDRGEWDLGYINGAETSPTSYAHIWENLTTVYNHDYQNWTANPPTGYENFDGTYDVCQIIDDQMKFAGYAAFWPKPMVMTVQNTQGTGKILREEILSTRSTVTDVFNATGTQDSFTATREPAAYPQAVNGTTIVWQELPMVFVGLIQKVVNGSGLGDPRYFEGNNSVKFPVNYLPAAGATVRMVYKVHTVLPDMTYEPNSPFVIGEWAWKFYQPNQQFRGVTVYGVTNLNDGDDQNVTGGGHTNVLDREIQYYLAETFNPTDLYDAVHKQDYRWVDLYDGELVDEHATTWNLTRGIDDKIYFVNATSELLALGWTESDWTGYYFRVTGAAGTSAAWVNKYQNGSAYVHDKNWAAKLVANTTGVSSLAVTPMPSYGYPKSIYDSNHGFGPLGDETFEDLVDFSFWYNISECTTALKYGPHIEIKLAKTTSATDTTWVNIRTWGNMKVDLSTWTHYTLNNIETFLSGTDADHGFYVTGVGSGTPVDSDGAAILTGTANSHSFEYWTKKLRDFYVLKVAVVLDTSGQTSGNTTCYVDDLDVGYLDKPSGIRYERVYNMEEDKLIPSDWSAYCTSAERVLLNGTLIPRSPFHNATAHERYYTINFTNGQLTFWYWVSGHYAVMDLYGYYIKVLYSTIEENDKGRYEWMVIGKDARTIDSAAGGYITEAFDSIKDITVSKIGMDVQESTWAPDAPYVMAGTGGDKAFYRDSLGRTHLKDDWCTTWPVASSNMIFMAGPRANLGTEYFNEFTNAFYPRSEYVVNDTGHSNTIMALTCWNRITYTSSVGADDGYGVISVYKDLNGTVGLIFWGIEAQDFFYTCEWFWSYPAGIVCPDGHTIVYSGIEYLQHENRGVTDIILHIDYSVDRDHPCISIANNERLGTISEKGQHDP